MTVMDDAAQTECEHARRFSDLTFKGREHALLVISSLVSCFKTYLGLSSVFSHSDGLDMP